MYQVKSEKFSGPLDLLLQLIEKEKLEITEISLAQVTDQFVERLEGMEEHLPEELADFLVVAARLLLLKSKALLPLLGQEEDLDDLEKQLRMYKEFVEASKKIQERIGEQKFSYTRKKVISMREVEFHPPMGLRGVAMKSVFLTVLKRLDPIVKMPRQMMEKTVSMQQTIFDIKSFISQQKKLGFNHMMKTAKNKTEVIMNFLALLELVKQKHLKLNQTNNFEDILIEKV
jgi:segregation and condensation protein A